jgi:hypothetical protein
MIELGQNFLNLNYCAEFNNNTEKFMTIYVLLFFYVKKNLDPTCNESTHNKLVTIYFFLRTCEFN